MSKIVVFGADGFIGRHLVSRLASLNKTDSIVAFDKFSDYKSSQSHSFIQFPNVQIVPGDIFNRSEVANALENADFVFHFITSTTPATSQNDPLIDIDTNIRSSIELLQICVEQGVKKIIFPSSGGTVYGNVDSDMISEESIPQPVSPYAIGKLTIEHYLRYYKQTHGLDYIVYRIANPYGPGQNIHGKQGVVPIFIYKHLNKEPLTVFGDGTMMRDYIYIDDLISMIVASYDKNNLHEVYNIGNGKGVSIYELVGSIEACSGYPVEKNYIETPSTYIQKSVLDIKRFSGEFGIKPTVSLEEGIKRTWDYVKELN